MKPTFTILFLYFTALFHAQTFTGTTGNITDDGQNNDFTVAVSGLPSGLNSSLGLIQVCLGISHTYDSDLNVFLVAPDGTTVNLFSGVGGDGDNFTDTCLNQSAATSINVASPPFSGIFKPQETIGNCNNEQSGNGTWTLRIVDTYPQDEGTVNNWSITFGPNAAVPFVFTSSNLPIVIINTGGNPIPDEPAIPATMGIIDNGAGNTNHTTDLPNNYNGDINIELRGAFSQSLPQKPYKIETLDATAAENNVSLLGMPAEHDWCLIANYNDKAFVRNTLAYKIFSEMGHYATRSRYCEVVVNGSYQGIYLLMESIKRDNNRVDIAKLETTENEGINLTGGYILKNDYWDSGNSWMLNYHPIDHPELDVHLVYDYPKPDTITPEQQSYIQNFTNELETALYSEAYADPTNGYAKYLDTDSFLDYFIINELARNNDGFKKSSYFYKDKDKPTGLSKLHAGPVWDFDWAWKNINECSIFAATDGSGWAHHINDCGPDINSPGWYVRLLQDPNFQDKLRCRWDNLRETVLSVTVIDNYIDNTASYLNAAQQRHFDKWGNLGINTGTPEVDADPATFSGQVNKFKNWIHLRLDWLDTNIPGNPANCSLVTTTNSAGNGFNLYPNPASEQLFVKINNDKALVEIEITDCYGKSILKSSTGSSTVALDVSTLADGIYLCKVTQGQTNIEIHKIAIIH